ncbi:hypothetical protein BDC45DRAFT_576286 [Circinella umbellata]|nr:hypothetical protein BDC45DRAFT_576286 [Circinella umbellata]
MTKDSSRHDLVVVGKILINDQVYQYACMEQLWSSNLLIRMNNHNKQQPPQQQQQHQAYYQSVYPQYAHPPPPPNWYVLMQDVCSWMAKVDEKVTNLESSVALIKEALSVQNPAHRQQQQQQQQHHLVDDDPLLDVSRDIQPYKRMAEYRIPVAGMIRKLDASKITQGLIRKHFIGEVLQLTGPNKLAIMDTMVKIVDKFHKRPVAVWDARPNKTSKTFRGLTETARDKLAMDVSIYLKHHLDDIPIDLCEKNRVSLYLVYYLFEKHISTSQRDKKQALVRTASMYSGSYMDTASESGLSAVMSSTLFEDEDDNSIAANASLSAAATSSTTTTTTTTTTSSLRSPFLPPLLLLPRQIRLFLCRITGILSDHKAALVFPLFRPPPHLLQNGREVKQMPLFRQIIGK